jgi:hypothetical protein
MNKLDLLFDAKQFAMVFSAATGDSSSVFKESRPGVRLKSGAATARAELSCDGQKAVHDVRLKPREK